MLPFLNNAACWFLSAVLLLSNGLPLAVHHAHEVGDDLEHHSHQLDRFGRMPATLATYDAERSVAAVTDHVHLLWFGWELTFLPPKGDRPVSAPSISSGGLLAKVDARDGAVRDIVCPLPAIVSRRMLDVDESNGLTSQTMQPGHLASLPLCDTARHLRSGVQLI
jgi:hypothetical protein